MATKQYRRRFTAALRRIYLLAMPVLLVTILLVNNQIFQFYYDHVYALRYQRTVAAVQQHWQQQGRLPRWPNVRYRSLPAGTVPYTYFVEQLAYHGPLRNETRYVAVISQRGVAVEVTVREERPAASSHKPVLELFSVTVSLGLFLLLSWLLFQVSLRRISYQLWKPFYQNLRRINAFHPRDRQPLALLPTDIREFSFFSEAIMGFTTRIQRSYDELREFTENTAHEIQTPLAVLLAKTELVLKRNNLTPPDRQEILEIKKTVQRLSALQKSLNLLSRVRSLHYGGELPREPLDAGELLAETLDRYTELLDYKQVSLRWETTGTWHLRTNRELLAILFDNLVRNAVQHNHAGGHVLVQVADTGITLCNSGPAPGSAQPATDLFQRYRTQSAESGHLGLGLALVEAVSEVLQLRCAYSYAEGSHCFSLVALARGQSGGSLRKN